MNKILDIADTMITADDRLTPPVWSPILPSRNIDARVLNSPLYVSIPHPIANGLSRPANQSKTSLIHTMWLCNTRRCLSKLGAKNH